MHAMANELIPASAEWVGMVVAGILGSAYYARKFVTKFAEEATATDKARAESDVVKVLREELKRLSDYNKELTEELRSLHNAVNLLNSEVADLRSENQMLKRRIEQLLGHPEFSTDEGEPE
jgi:FtsZ-binding cell division protein ZapB